MRKANQWQHLLSPQAPLRKEINIAFLKNPVGSPTHRVILYPGYAWLPGMVITNAPFYAQKCPDLADTLYGHTTCKYPPPKV